MVNISNKFFSGIPSRRVNTLMGTPDPNPLRTKDMSLYIKQIYDEKRVAEYAGGTLVFEFDNEPVMINIGRGLNKEEDFWSAMVYCKHKSTTTFHYAEALSIIESRVDMQAEVTKMLLARD